MALNKDIFQRDPTTYALPNDGVAKVAEPETDEQWKVARYEVEHFVCDGAYHQGLRKILETYLENLGQPTQRAVWVHGFYGSGKSHLIRVLDFLWRDVQFPDGASARGLAKLPADVSEALSELSTEGKRKGGLWSAAGTLGAGSPNDPRTAILQIALRAAGLPERVNLAQFDLWVRQEGWHDDISAGLKAKGRDYNREIKNLFVSTALAEELIKANPDFASKPSEALGQLRAQYPELTDISTDVMVEIMRQVFEMQSEKDGRLPCVLMVLDELQQYLGDSHDRTETVRDAVEAAVTQFGSNVLFVAAGQQAMEATTILQRLQGRFTVNVQLEEKDIQRVLQQTVLLKKTSAEPELRTVLDAANGEIARHLGGTRIGSNSSDDGILISDYPLLPTRQRFWGAVLRAVDRGGAATQLRTQLRLAHEASRTVAKNPLGNVVGADFIFDQQRTTMLETNVLLRETHEDIEKLNDGSADGNLQSRVCQLLFLIAQLDPSIGVRATAETLADLLVTDLPGGSASLRHNVPDLLKSLLDSGIVTQVEDEYRIQTREGAEWDKDYRSRSTAIKSDDNRISTERETRLRAAVEAALKGVSLTQGASKTGRSYVIHFGPEAPLLEAKVPMWVRSGWDVTESAVKTDAAQAGPDSPTVFVYLPRESADELKAQIAGALAAGEVLGRPTPTTDEGRAAKSGIESRQQNHNTNIGEIISRILAEARVFQGGGNEVQAIDFRAAVEQASASSLSRLFDRFAEADSAMWSKVADKARRGDPDALSLVGYSGEVDQHGVCKEIVQFIGGAGQQGNDIRRYFEAPKYGWPRDAVDAALIVLTGCGSLRAIYRGRDTAVSDLTGTTIQQAEFRAEQINISTKEKLAIRKLLQDTSVSCRIGDEVAGISLLLDQLESLAQQAGGQTPLPERPSTIYIDDIKALCGNELLLDAYNRRDQLLKDFKDWSEAAKKVQIRQLKWDKLQRFLDHAKSLPIYVTASAEVMAIKEQRKLLSDPDPVPALSTSVTTALRDAVKDARARHLDAYGEKLEDLEGNSIWQQLSKERQQAIRQNRGLVPLEPLKVETDEDLLIELDARQLSAWDDMTFAISERVEQALLDAAKELEPKTQRVSLKRSTVRNETELDAYLAEVRTQVVPILKDGPVVLP